MSDFQRECLAKFYPGLEYQQRIDPTDDKVKEIAGLLSA